MKYIKTLICITICCITAANCLADVPIQNNPLTSFYLDSKLGIRALSDHPEVLTTAGEELLPRKSPNEAFLYSLAIPGMGQIYSGAKHGYIYTAAEVGLLVTYFLLRNSAVNTRDDYRDIVRENVIFIGPGSFENWDIIEDFEHATQYETWNNPYSGEDSEATRKTLERTGKWFWKDMDPQHKNTYHNDIPVGSGSKKHRLEAFDLRQEANDTFQQARTVLGLVILNHVFSAVEARITAKRWNQKQQQTSNIHIELDTELSAGSLKSALVLRKQF